MSSEILYKLYKFIFLVNTNSIRSGANVQFDINLAATGYDDKHKVRGYNGQFD